MSETGVHVALFQCPRCGRPITWWNVGLSAEEIKSKPHHLKCADKDCNWSGPLLGGEAKQLWSAPWTYRTD
jgi:hypothetical protein